MSTSTFNCAINGNEIITNGVCNENVVLMSKSANPPHVARAFVGQAKLNASLKHYPVARNLGGAERTFRKGDRVPEYVMVSITSSDCITAGE